MKRNQRGDALVSLLGILVMVIFCLGFIGGCMWVYPKYNVYSSEMSGKAILAEAESSRQVAILEAQALKDSAKFKAEAEIERARGVASANGIIGDSLKGNAEYLRYLYIDALRDTPNQVIYLPTEAGLPILEAARTAPRPAPVAEGVAP